MWLVFEGIEEKKDMVSRQGKKFDGWVIHGTKKGFQETPDEPYTKTIFDNQSITVVEKGVVRRGQSLLQFLQKAVKPGDTLSIQSERDGKFWRWTKIENRSQENPSYEPLTDEQADLLRSAQKPAEDSENNIPSWAE
jgi:hypothetical protein